MKFSSADVDEASGRRVSLRRLLAGVSGAEHCKHDDDCRARTHPMPLFDPLYERLRIDVSKSVDDVHRYGRSDRIGGISACREGAHTGYDPYLAGEVVFERGGDAERAARARIQDDRLPGI